MFYFSNSFFLNFFLVFAITHTQTGVDKTSELAVQNIDHSCKWITVSATLDPYLLQSVFTHTLTLYMCTALVSYANNCKSSFVISFPALLARCQTPAEEVWTRGGLLYVVWIEWFNLYVEVNSGCVLHIIWWRHDFIRFSCYSCYIYLGNIW